MALTPQDIQSQQFHVRFRGFDVDEVDDFLEKVAEDYLTVIQENKQLRERLEEMKNELGTYRGQEKSFQKAIVSAQQIADEMKTKSEQEAEDIVAKAEREAEGLRNQAHGEIAALEKELDRLRSQKDSIRDELRSMLQGYLDGLEESFPGQMQQSRAASKTMEAGSSKFEYIERENTASTGQEVSLDTDDDFYEKVDLTDDFRLPDEENFDSSASNDRFTLSEKDDSTLPDLDGEMIFSLDDPLDDLTPDININEQEGKKS